MKNIRNLTPWWRTLEEDRKSKALEFRRLTALEKWLFSNIPDNIIGRYSFDAMGDTCIRVFIHLDKNENSTVNLLKWLPSLKKRRFEIEKFWRKESGYYAYRVDRKYPNCINYIILFEETANIDGCVIVKKRKMQTIYTTNCEKESVIL